MATKNSGNDDNMAAVSFTLPMAVRFRLQRLMGTWISKQENGEPPITFSTMVRVGIWLLLWLDARVAKFGNSFEEQLAAKLLTSEPELSLTEWKMADVARNSGGPSIN